MSRMQFFRVLVPAYATGMTTEAIRSGYRNTMIYPINREAEKLKQIRASDVYDSVSPYWTRYRFFHVFVSVVLAAVGCCWMTSR